MTKPLEFDDALDQRLDLASGEAYFGRNVLQGLVDGIVTNTREVSPGPIIRAVYGPVVLGCAMTMDDPDLMEALEQVGNACIVITKQESRHHGTPKWSQLEDFNESHTHGLIAWAFPELEGLAPHDGGRPRVVGPYDPDWRRLMDIGGVREVGYRKAGGHLVPIVHAKLALLGDVWSVEEGDDGFERITPRFVPTRLWVGSANFTQASRRSLEMGMWTSDTELMEAARRFLIGLIAQSEPLGKGPDGPQPELLPVEYDDEAFRAAHADYLAGQASGE